MKNTTLVVFFLLTKQITIPFMHLKPPFITSNVRLLRSGCGNAKEYINLTQHKARTSWHYLKVKLVNF